MVYKALDLPALRLFTAQNSLKAGRSRTSWTIDSGLFGPLFGM